MAKGRLWTGLVAFVCLLCGACSSASDPEPATTKPEDADAGASPTASESADEPQAGSSASACYLDEAAARKAPLGGFRAPAGKYLGKCSRDAIENLLFCTHLSDADAPKDPHCQALTREKPCLACIFNDRGAILDVKYPNVPGCIALALGETTNAGCGGAYYDWQRCQKDGCASCFDAKVKASTADRNACVEKAASTVCNERASFDRCSGLDQNAEYVHNCRQPEPIDDRYLGRLYNYFCGAEGAF